MLARAKPTKEWDMLRNLKRGAVLCAALCALGVATASSAFAAEFTFGAAPAAITGSQTAQNIFTVKNTAGSGIQVKCSVATFEGTSSTTSGTDLTITPTYSGCTLGGLAATVKMNGCKYTFTGAGSAALTANVDIVGCTASKTITVTKGNCTIAVGEQSGLTHVVFTSEGSASEMDVLATATVSNISSTQTGSECPAPGATQSDGTYSGTVTVKAFSDSGSRSATKHEHTYEEVICGTQISVTAD
jgi:hypothetical protein